MRHHVSLKRFYDLTMCFKKIFFMFCYVRDFIMSLSYDKQADIIDVQIFGCNFKHKIIYILTIW